MKLGLFSDSHYCYSELHNKTRRPILSLNKIKQALLAFADENVDLCICLGDIIDRGTDKDEPKECLTQILQLLRTSAIPFCILAGNHDLAVFSKDEFAALTGSPKPPCTLDSDRHRFIFLDANYFSDMTSYDATEDRIIKWTDCNLPPEQLAFLQNALDTTQKPCIVLLHQNLESDADPKHRVNNAHEARKIMEDSKKVALVLQGHYHRGADRIENGIRYLTLPAMCEGENNHFLILDL